MESFLRDHECNDICVRLGLDIEHPTRNLTGISVLGDDPVNNEDRDELEEDQLADDDSEDN